jgi:xanthine dehydrogenase accessory factor
MAKDRLKAGSPEPDVRKQIHDKSAGSNQSGMICSGEQTILLLPVQQNDRAIIQNIIASLELNRNGTLLLTPEGINFETTVPKNDFEYHFIAEQEWWYKEKTGHKNKLFIIGGGHCALALSKLMSSMDFYITLFEERAGLNTLEENKFVHEIIVVEDYTALGNLISSGPGQYVVIMTFGYRTDDIAVRSLLNKQYSYLGVLGSKTKMEKLFAAYRDEGVDENVLQRICTPVGLDINSETPEEIAVSIAAQIIQIKNRT